MYVVLKNITVIAQDNVLNTPNIKLSHKYNNPLRCKNALIDVDDK
ncbi:MAG TPA: hypothetical protein VF242_00385 [Nitrososphaeraceae archaeon]